MKKITSLIIILLLFSVNIDFCQTNSTSIHPWSASVYGGLFFDPISPSDYNRTGNAGFDISYSYTPYFVVYINGTYNFLNHTNDQYSHSSTGLLESTMGVKFYADTVFFKLFTELGFGYYQRLTHFSYTQDGYSSSDNNDGIGIDFGLGVDFKLDNKVNFFIKGKLHFTTVDLGGNSLSFAGLYSGIKYNF